MSDSDEDSLKQLLKRRKSSSESLMNNAANNNIQGLCDVCQLADGHCGFNLQKCMDCGVCIHDRCYGIVHTNEDDDNDDDDDDDTNSQSGSNERKLKDWKCHPCSAVGKEFLVSKPHQEERKVSVSQRPTKCYLCNVSSKGHAMNLLYDYWGKDGRPLVVKDSSGRDTVAWVHTLCALVINSNPRTAGCVYGCDEYGRYEDFDNVMEEESYMDNMDGANFSKQIYDVEYIPHHFVRINEHDPDHAFLLKDIRKNNLKCDVCGIQAQGSHYFPIQCIANDEQEYKPFQKKHRNTMECTVAMHVGCARWSSNCSSRIFFRPETEVDDLIVGGYCSLHASNISGEKPTYESPGGNRRVPEEINESSKRKLPNKATDSTSLHPSSKTKVSKSGLKINRKKAPWDTMQHRFLVEMKANVEQKIAKAIGEKKNVEEAITRCKNFWSQRAEAHNVRESFSKNWRLVEARLVALYPSLNKFFPGVKEPRESSSNDQSSKLKAVSDSEKPLEERHPEVMEAYRANPWSLLWMPNYIQGAINIEDWDSIEEIPAPGSLGNLKV